MANQKQLDILRHGVEEWNRYRETAPQDAVDLSGAYLHNADLGRANLVDADLSGVNLSRANLSRAKLNPANLSEADLASAVLAGASLSGANLIKADLSRADLLRANLIRADLSSADLTLAARLAGVGLHGATLLRTNFLMADLTGADLSKARLVGANFELADLSGANLVMADLTETRLGGANLSWADLRWANLFGATIAETIFGRTDLTDTQYLDSCRHLGPSTIDHHTIVQSGSLPISFLRGCGLPNQLIENFLSLLQRTDQFPSCFISYSEKDEAFAERLHIDLQNKGVRCWFAAHNIQGGKKIHEQIDEAIRLHDRLLLILSEASMSSEWVKTEVANARRKEIDVGKRVLFPVSLVPFEAVRRWKNFDADTGKDSAREIREYFIPDFSDWKDHDAYQAAFDRLLRDLAAEDRRPTAV